MNDLEEKIEEYADGLFEDLGFSDLPEERKAEIFARVEERLHKVIVDELSADLDSSKMEILKKALSQQDYKIASGILDMTEKKDILKRRIERELNQLKKVIEKEQRYVREKGRI